MKLTRATLFLSATALLLSGAMARRRRFRAQRILRISPAPLGDEQIVHLVGMHFVHRQDR